MKVDKNILNANDVIVKNIDCLNKERGFLSQNILSQLRNFVESIMIKIYNVNFSLDCEVNYETIKLACKYVQNSGTNQFLCKFYQFLQKSASHYTLDENCSERLMLKYFDYLVKSKRFLRDEFGMTVLENIEKFPLNMDEKFKEYYEKIALKINTKSNEPFFQDRYYIQKIKPFYVLNEMFYEVTFTIANDKVSKFDRVIAFTKLDLTDNYSSKLFIRNDFIEIMGKRMPVQIIEQWEVSIRPCELVRFASFFGLDLKITTGDNEYKELMKFLTSTGMSLNEFVLSADSYYDFVKTKVLENVKSVKFMRALDLARNVIKRNLSGCNTLQYVLLNLNNRILKSQYKNEKNGLLSNLYLLMGCKPFEDLPLNTSLPNHNPKIWDLFQAISTVGREHELLARLIKNNTENRGMLFTNISELSQYGEKSEIEELITTYNNALYKTHRPFRDIEIYKNHVYINNYVEDTNQIVEQLRKLSNKHIVNYKNAVEHWINHSDYTIDCDEKKEILKTMFDKSCVSFVYGSAGTGKSTLINHLSHYFNAADKLYLANTNPAVENLRRKVTAPNCTFKTIAKFLTKNTSECDILIIDECSMVSNKDMKKILSSINFKALVLVGDVYQIESIRFGNWFSIARNFIHDNAVFELKKPYRTKNENLLLLWNRVRTFDENILESLTKNKYSKVLDDSIFDYVDDQIILCLNYDGLYGINNINRFLQGNNPNPSIRWGVNYYKVGDPVLFNESERFAPLIYNNLKGIIMKIVTFDNQIQFDIKVFKGIDEFSAAGYDFQLLEADSEGTVIRFFVNKHHSTDEDDDDFNNIVPFQISYAVSIHKAQGLEYNKVKLIITSEVEELISHNIFYTAITRAKENLEIYWTPETEQKILNSFEEKSNTKDTMLLKNKYNL